MKQATHITLDGTEAVASVAYRCSEVIAIYPITPSSGMGESSDAWAAAGKKNIWGNVPSVIEMQSEGGAAGAVHGALQGGALTTTFTSSQGLLLMIPNMFKIAGELTPAVFHVAARAVATHALSIFGDHSDVMSTRSCGWAMLGSASVQEAADFAAISHAATLEARIPFIHFFDGFRTSHEVAKVAIPADDVLLSLLPAGAITAHRNRSLSPDRPVLRGTAQNPDVFFQAREACNKFYTAVPAIVREAMKRFAEKTGRSYDLFEYVGAPDAKHVIIAMGSACDTATETIEALVAKGESVGLLKVRLYRPFCVESFLAKLPKTVETIAVLDRTKEPGAPGEPMYLDVIAALDKARREGRKLFAAEPRVIGGRYGLSSKEFTPAMLKGLFNELKADGGKKRPVFTLGIQDDVTNLSIPADRKFTTEPADVVRCVFYGLGSDGTVGANKNSIKIIGENTDLYAQGYFVYDSKKSGSVTVSHLRFGPRLIRSAYLVSEANFVGCHQYGLIERYDVLETLVKGGTFLLNSPLPADKVWDALPKKMQQRILDTACKFYVIDASRVAKDSGMGNRINTVMQVCFFALSGVLPREKALDQIKESIRKTYGKKGEEVVAMNLKAIDATLDNLFEVKVPAKVSSEKEFRPAVVGDTGPFVKGVLGEILAARGDALPVSAFPVDGTFPTATSQYEKRCIADEVPVWESDLCIQCMKCVLVCPHAVIRAKVYDPAAPAAASVVAANGFPQADARVPEWKKQGLKVTLGISTDDCTGCGVCVDVCPARDRKQANRKAINMTPIEAAGPKQRIEWSKFLALPEADRRTLDTGKVRTQQFQRPLFEYSGACAGCGETPYLKLMSQLFGDRAVIANATGCSSIYGGNLPTTPWAKDENGRGPAWCNSLFEDNAEFGLGIRLAIDKQAELAQELVRSLAPVVGESLAKAILEAPQKNEADLHDQRERVAELRKKVESLLAAPRSLDPKDADRASRLLPILDNLVKRCVWIVGGDGWAYDIGFGGLDHVLSSGKNVKVLVLDTEVYSNTGGQMSKATPRAAVAKFAAGGKSSEKKDLALMAAEYGNVYVARVAMGSNDEHTLKAFIEAEAWDGPAIIIAYSHCIAHGINMTTGMKNQKAAVDAGSWVLFRYNPALADKGQNPFQLDSSKPRASMESYLLMENRFKMLTKMDADRSAMLFKSAQADADRRWRHYEHLAARAGETVAAAAPAAVAAAPAPPANGGSAVKVDVAAPKPPAPGGTGS